jgi:glycosyltransferase involved in cell wall biosynthesis
MLDASVIICTHNPRPKYLARVLDALRKQLLPKDRWELLIIDNASNEPVASVWDISWHPNASHILESELGLSPARRRGMREAKSGLLVFVDDDNVLDKNYLSEAVNISLEWPVLGVWGSGCIRPEFEIKPPNHLHKFLCHQGLRDVPTPRWSNVSTCFDALPIGAGLCVRASVAAAYRRWCEQSVIQITDRRGKQLSSGGDDEICLVACQQGLGMGVFPELGMTHLIPKERISEHSLVRKTEGDMTAVTLLEFKFRGVTPDFSLWARALLSTAKSIVMDGRVERLMKFAKIKGLIEARKIINGHRETSSRLPAGRVVD